MVYSPGRILVLLTVFSALGGCHSAPKPKGKSPLSTTQMSPDCVVLEVFFVRFPFDDPEANGQLWQEVDEQHFPPELRQRLARNGFRVGLVGGQIPFTLSTLLELEDKPAPAGQANLTETGEAQEPPRVVRRHMPVRAKQRGEILASDVHKQLLVLIRESGQLFGETYQQAQGILAVKGQPLPDGRVSLTLLPEVHHDEPNRRWVGSQGMLRLETSRPKRTFDEMAIEATVASGGMILLGCLPNRPGSLGHHFFTEENGQLEQKLLVVRVAQTQHDDLFCPTEVLDLSAVCEQ